VVAAAGRKRGRPAGFASVGLTSSAPVRRGGGAAGPSRPARRRRRPCRWRSPSPRRTSSPISSPVQAQGELEVRNVPFFCYFHSDGIMECFFRVEAWLFVLWQQVMLSTFKIEVSGACVMANFLRPTNAL
jgi:hypothetical protein